MESAGIYGADEDYLEEEGEEGEGPGAGGAPPQSDPGDLREMVGWQVLDRTRILSLAQQLVEQQRQSLQGGPQQQAAGGDVGNRGEEQRAGAAAALAAALAAGGGASSESARPAKRQKPAKPSRGNGGRGAGGAGADSDGAAAGGVDGNVVVWLRHDLRLHDNPALAGAARLASNLGGRVTFVFVHRCAGGAAGWAAAPECRLGGRGVRRGAALRKPWALSPKP